MVLKVPIQDLCKGGASEILPKCAVGSQRGQTFGPQNWGSGRGLRP